MSYIVNRTDGNIAAVVNDGVIDTTTSLNLVGKGVPNYAETVAEDLVSLLENYASVLAPRRPLPGQLWYNKADNQIQVYDGDKEQFKTLNNVVVSSTTPTNPVTGDLWFNSEKRQLFFYRNNAWQLIAPSYAASQGRCELVVETVGDTHSHNHSVITLFNNNLRTIVISSDDEFQPYPVIQGFETVKPGINLASQYSEISNAILNGTSTFAQTAYGLDEVPDADYMHANADTSTIGNLTVTNSNFTLGTTGNLFVSATNSSISMTANVDVPFTLNGYGGSSLTLDNNTNWIAVNKTTPTADFDVGGSINADETITSQNGYYFSDTSEITSTDNVVRISPGGVNVISADSAGIVVTGNVAGANLIASSAGVYFPDGTLQTTAANNISGAITGTGSVGKLAYFNTSSTIAATPNIATNGISLTLTDGLLKVRNTDTPTLSLENYTNTPWLALPITGKIDFSGLGSINYYKVDGTVNQSITINPGNQLNANLQVGVVGGVAGTIVNGTLKVDTPGIRFNDGTLQTTAATNSVQVSYPSTVYQGATFNWGIVAGVPGETWYATVNPLSTPPSGFVTRIPTLGVNTLDTNGAASFTNQNLGTYLGEVEITFNFSKSGTVVKRISVLAPASRTTADVQTFLANSTWTKPTGYSTSSRVFIQAWGGGGSGGAGGTYYGSGPGGGGGGYNEAWIKLSDLSATETIVVGRGGASVGPASNGNQGGNTSVGSIITAYGGAGGGGILGYGGNYLSCGGSGGGQLSAGTTDTPPIGTYGGGPNKSNSIPGKPIRMSFAQAYINNDPNFNDGSLIIQFEGGGGTGYTPASDGFWHGGGGGFGFTGGWFGQTFNQNYEGGKSVWGGGGGGGTTFDYSYVERHGAGGISTFGGNGGAGSMLSTAQAGSVPGGGGGGTGTGTSGAGGDGKVIITVFP
jgi:hypothetical protein